MDVDHFITGIVLKSRLHNCFYHFTDRRNLGKIREHGLLSAVELDKRGIVPSAMGGNEWSKQADAHFGMDRYVHLCFTRNHPMAFLAKEGGRIEECQYLHIDPWVIKLEGVLISKEVSNKSGAVCRPPADALSELDLEVLYQRTEWKDPLIKERLKAVEKYEILVPNLVPLSLIRRGL